MRDLIERDRLRENRERVPKVNARPRPAPQVLKRRTPKQKGTSWEVVFSTKPCFLVMLTVRVFFVLVFLLRPGLDRIGFFWDSSTLFWGNPKKQSWQAQKTSNPPDPPSFLFFWDSLEFFGVWACQDCFFWTGSASHNARLSQKNQPWQAQTPKKLETVPKNSKNQSCRVLSLPGPRPSGIAFLVLLGQSRVFWGLGLPGLLFLGQSTPKKVWNCPKKTNPAVQTKACAALELAKHLSVFSSAPV